jgi:hypothetical protein
VKLGAMIKEIFDRIYGQYLMPSRLSEYEQLIVEAKKNGYIHLSIRDLCAVLEKKDIPDKIFVHRHDIDTNIRTAKKMFKIEQQYCIKATYYFRLPTLDFDFMREIEEYGSEASYHFEEIATFAKREHIKNATDILKNLRIIQEEFLKNLRWIEKRLGKKIVTVASHGDFANRKLKVSNFEILKDPYFRKRCGIKCESYDENLMKIFDIRISDGPYPIFYSPISVYDAIREGKEHIFFLSHPGHWEVNIIEATIENIKRFYEGLFMKIIS